MKCTEEKERKSSKRRRSIKQFLDVSVLRRRTKENDNDGDERRKRRVTAKTSWTEWTVMTTITKKKP